MKMYNHQGVAAVLSILLPGLGQVYNGKATMALLHFVIHCILIYEFVYTILEGNHSWFFFAMCVFTNIIWSANSAYSQALSHNAQKDKEEAQYRKNGKASPMVN